MYQWEYEKILVVNQIHWNSCDNNRYDPVFQAWNPK